MKTEIVDLGKTLSMYSLKPVFYIKGRVYRTNVNGVQGMQEMDKKTQVAVTAYEERVATNLKRFDAGVPNGKAQRGIRTQDIIVRKR